MRTTYLTYELLPSGKKPIKCKWVYQIYYKVDSPIERHKARLVVACSQVKGEDFTVTFTPMAKMTLVQRFLALAKVKGWFLQQTDANNVVSSWRHK